MRKKLKEYRNNLKQEESRSLIEAQSIEAEELKTNDITFDAKEDTDSAASVLNKSNDAERLGTESYLPIKIVETITGSSYEILPPPLMHPFFKEFINILPLKYKLIGALRLGLYDGNIHSIEEIAELYNISEEEVIANLNKIIDLLLTLVKRYEELYSCSFPNLNGELTLIKRLSKK